MPLFPLIGCEIVKKNILRKEHKGLSLTFTGRVDMTRRGDLFSLRKCTCVVFLRHVLLITAFFRSLEQKTLTCAAVFHFLQSNGTYNCVWSIFPIANAHSVAMRTFSTLSNVAFQPATISAPNTLKNTMPGSSWLIHKCKAEIILSSKTKRLSVCLCLSLQNHKKHKHLSLLETPPMLSGAFYSHFLKMNINVELSSVITAKSCLMDFACYLWLWYIKKHYTKFQWCDIWHNEMPCV